VVRASPALLALAGILASAAAAAAGPPAALVQAVQKTNAASSASLTLTVRTGLGSRTVSTLRLHGIEQPSAQAGSFVLTITPDQAGLGQASEIVHGSKVYVHYALLDTLHAKNPSVKSWVVVDSRSALGVDPAGLTALGSNELTQMTGLRAVGAGSVGGVAVTRYAGALDLRKASSLPELQQLLAHLPSAVASVLKGKEQFVFSVGADGYVHRVTASLGVPLAGARLRVDVDATLGAFGASPGAILPPPSSDVMTLDSFERLLGLPTAGDTALLDKVVLKTSQVGAGYTVSVIPGGRQVTGEPTLDFCGLRYPSEQLRTARLQVAYTKKGAAFKASNEVVTYKPGGAQQALREVAHAASTCPNGTVSRPPKGVTRLVRHTRVLKDARLLPGAVAVLDVETGVVKGKPVTLREVAVYQVRGNVLSAVYGTGPSVATAEAGALRAAALSAADLKRYVPDSAAPTS
jgi:hypothetical protein